MNIEELLSLCQCPVCHSALLLNKERGCIVCSHQHTYPLVKKRIPVFLVRGPMGISLGRGKVDWETCRRFSRQWRMYQKEDNIWGWSKKEFHDLYLNLKGCGLEENEFSKKIILDLGCGHGMYSYFFAEKGAQVVGFDISDGFLGLEERLTNEEKKKLNFIRGDVAYFPLREGVFDYVWCSGVLHHTPDTRESFQKVCHTVKKGGRFYVWLYKPVFYTAFLQLIRKLTTRIPGYLMTPLCYFLAPFFALTKVLLSAIKLNYRQFEKRTWRENALSIHDTLAPPYRHHHTKEEVVGWFKEAGFGGIVVAEESALGFGVYGDKL